MLHIPVIRFGRAYESVDQIELCHHQTGEPVVRVSQANSGLISRDLSKYRSMPFDGFSSQELLERCGRAARLFVTADLPLGDPAGPSQSFDDYVQQLSATTGMPITFCRSNAGKIEFVLASMDRILGGLTRGLNLSVLD